jgi:hypothetical protein
MTRRDFNKRFAGILLMFSTLSSALLTTGCSVYDRIVQWVGVGIAAFTSIVKLLAGAGIVSTVEGMAITAILGLFKTGMADVQVAIAEYENAPAASKQTAAQKVSVALQAVIDGLQKFWNDLSIPDGQLASLIQGLLGIILSTLAGFMTQLPVVPVTRKSFPRMIAVIPKKISWHYKTTAFVKEFNGLLQQNGYSQYAIQ